MEIGEQRAYHLKLKTWIDKYVGFSCPRANARRGSGTRSVLAHSVLQRADRSGANRHNTPPRLECLIQLCRRRIGNEKNFPMQLVLLHLLHMYRLKCSQPDM